MRVGKTKCISQKILTIKAFVSGDKTIDVMHMSSKTINFEFEMLLTK